MLMMENLTSVGVHHHFRPVVGENIVEIEGDTEVFVVVFGDR